jgi:DeoR family transcriptional regulator, aga operon transcriptional repressor
MTRADRMNAILDLLGSRGQVEIDEIVTSLGISAATARRDLDVLADQKLLVRTHGGAVGNSLSYDLPGKFRGDPDSVAKQAIAAAASAMVTRGMTVGLSGGTTSTTVAGALGSRADLMEPSPHPNLTIVTNAINIASQLVVRPQIKIVITGGVVQTRSYELVGPYSDMVLNRISMDIAFIGVNGIDPRFGATVHDEDEASINSLMAARASRPVIIADSSKIGVRAFASMGGPELFSTLITDSGITAEQKAAFEEQGVEVIVAIDPI